MTEPQFKMNRENSELNVLRYEKKSRESLMYRLQIQYLSCLILLASRNLYSQRKRDGGKMAASNFRLIFFMPKSSEKEKESLSKATA